MSSYSNELRKQLQQADGDACAYCKTSIHTTGQPLTIDHIRPRVKGGGSELENLCLACRRCNEFKSDKDVAEDPLTGEVVFLFSPRQDSWAKHFAWDETGTRLLGLTEIGRATIIALNMNNTLIVKARARWVRVGWHPPS